MPDTNPIVKDIVYAGRDLLAEDALDTFFERAGGKEVVDQLVNNLTIACIMEYPILAVAPNALAATITSGIAAGVAIEQRAEKNDQLLREMGVE